MKASRSVEKILGLFPSDVQALAHKARRLLLKLLPGGEESVDSSVPVLGYGYGPGYRGMVCTMLFRTRTLYEYEYIDEYAKFAYSTARSISPFLIERSMVIWRMTFG